MSQATTNQQNREFAEETVSQISSTFDLQQAIIQQSSNMNQQTKNCEEKTKKVSNYKDSNNQLINLQSNQDELLDQDILNKCSMNSPNENLFENDLNNNFENCLLDDLQENSNQQSNIMNSISINQNSLLLDEASIIKILDQSIFEFTKEDQSFDLKVDQEQMDNFKFECDDILNFLDQISQKLKNIQKSNKNYEQFSNDQQSFFEQIKQLEILSTSSMEKMRYVQKFGNRLYSEYQKPSLEYQKKLTDKLKEKLLQKLLIFKNKQKKQFKKNEEQKFKYQINEYQLNQRVGQLEDVYQRQQEEITNQANKNEQLKYEKKVLSKNYEERLSEIEKLVQIIQQSIHKDNRSAEKKNQQFFHI